MPRQYSFAYRRRNSEKFPPVCDTCVPRRLFHLFVDQQQHEQSRCHQNGILKAATSNFFEYSSPQLLPTFDFSASSSSLSFVTESNLNIFLSNEIEPDTACNKSFRAVVNRLIKFMQNNFPDQLRPSAVIKVNQAVIVIMFRLPLFLCLSFCMTLRLCVCLSVINDKTYTRVIVLMDHTNRLQHA